MSFEAITGIAAAEEEAKQAVSDAEAKAKQIIAEAGKNGKAAVEAAVLRAENELALLRTQTDASSAEEAKAIAEESEQQKTALREKAEERLEKAAALVVERIVNS